ncbi:WW domain-containing oxidoreductase isoform X2 [Cimex lectularius]|uniref:WW domain-containing oxidoreductase n=1 Tax=Cimex lectularius TaxID=79782 RepID=A0A8I6RQV1_CIMLE|nr:WW domain-containing oxidoreductase isoform X2 [Cimex lectularius]
MSCLQAGKKGQLRTVLSIMSKLPFGWERIIDENGKVMFADHANKTVTYTDPRLAFAIEEKEYPSDFRQRFDASSTALQVLHGKDLSGKTAVITGSNTGIGFETARSLALHGCHIIMACRDEAKAQTAIDKIKAERHDANLTFMKLCLDQLQSVKNFAEEYRKTYGKLDILILNAGIFGIPYSQTENGYETVFQVNHLSHAFLTLLLEDSLTRGVPSRVVFVSSESHRYSSLTAETISEGALSPSRDNYWSMMAYNHSKLLNVVFAGKLSEKWAHKGIAVFSLHPGNMVSSELSRYWWPYRFLFSIVRPFTKSLQQASSTTVYCATSLDLNSVTGLYFNNCFRTEPSKTAIDQKFGNKVWELTKEMILKAGFKIDM